MFGLVGLVRKVWFGRFGPEGLFCKFYIFCIFCIFNSLLPALTAVTSLRYLIPSARVNSLNLQQGRD